MIGFAKYPVQSQQMSSFDKWEFVTYIGDAHFFSMATQMFWLVGILSAASNNMQLS